VIGGTKAKNIGPVLRSLFGSEGDEGVNGWREMENVE
jgi:hypothetical protein